MTDYKERTWAEIDLSALGDNFKVISSLAGKQKVMAMVKADAYGHGAVTVAKKLSQLGVDSFGVATIEEALELRKAGISEPILILGYTPAKHAQKLLDFNLTQTVTGAEYARELSDAITGADKSLYIHIKLDTGMCREGIVCRNRTDLATEEACTICGMSGLYAEGIFTHLCDADNEDRTYTEAQISLFCEVLRKIEEKGIHFEIKHCANSATVLQYPCVQFNMVRAGIAMYGLSPDSSGELPDGFRPVMSLKTVITELKDVDEGSDVGYGRTYKTSRKTKIAVIPIGYGDGFHRLCSNRIRVGINGTIVPLVGRVCMDLSMLDVTDLPNVKRGDIVTLFGHDKDTVYPVEHIAKAAMTINYEIVTGLSKRVPRIYIDEK